MSGMSNDIELLANVLGARIQELQVELAPGATRADVARVLRSLADDIETESLS